MSTYLFVFSDGASHLRTYGDDAAAARAAVEPSWGRSTVRAVWPVADDQRDRLALVTAGAELDQAPRPAGLPVAVFWCADCGNEGCSLCSPLSLGGAR